MAGRRGWVLLLAALAVWAFGLRAVIRSNQSASSGAKGDDRDQRHVEALAIIAQLPPLVAPRERIGASDVTRVNASTVVALLRAGRTAEVGEVLEAAQEEFERDPRKEALVDSLLGGFLLAGVAIPVLDAWVSAEPASFAAPAARAAARIAAARRDDSCGSTERGAPRRASPSRSLALAREDLELAIVQRPSCIAAHTLLFASYVADCTPVPRALLGRALEACSTCAGPREQYQLGLRPAWGGSRAAMRAFAEESAAAQGDAPRLRALQGYADWDDCVNLSAQRPPRRALELCDRALGAYRASRFLRAKALVLYRSDRFADAVAASTEALEADPFDVDTLVERARAYTQLADWSRGAGDLRVALQLVPAHGQGVALLSWMVEQLDWEARSALSRHEFGEALQAFETMASAFPGVEPFQKTRRAVANRLGPRYAGGQIQ